MINKYTEFHRDKLQSSTEINKLLLCVSLCLFYLPEIYCRQTLCLSV